MSNSTGGLYGQYTIEQNKRNPNLNVYANPTLPKIETSYRDSIPTKYGNNVGYLRYRASTPTGTGTGTEDGTGTDTNATYGEFVGTGTNTSTGTNGTTGAGTSTGTGTGSEVPLTYAEFVALEKAREGKKLEDAGKRIDDYEKGLLSDANASYMQHMSSYGTKAENMAKAGLTGGGYSDYLDSMAYAQNRAEKQAIKVNANAMREEAQTTYADNIAALDKSLYTYDDSDSVNLNGYSYIDGNIDMKDIITDIQYGRLLDPNTGAIYNSWETLEEVLLKARGDGQTITETDLAAAKDAFDKFQLYDSGKVSPREYYDSLLGDEAKTQIVNNALDSTEFDANARNKAVQLLSGIEHFDQNANNVEGSVVDINRDKLSTSDFGKFKGTGKNGVQDTYVQAIINDAKAGKIREGQIVCANYGAQENYNGFFVYVGNGVFVGLTNAYPLTLESNSEKLYVPDGYIFDYSKKYDTYFTGAFGPVAGIREKSKD